MSVKYTVLSLGAKCLVPSIKSAITVDAIADKVTDGIDVLATKSVSGLSDERLSQVTKGCSLGANTLLAVSDGLDPNGEEGRKLSDTERAAVKKNAKEAILCLVTQEMIDAAIDAAVEKALVKFA